VSHYSVFWRCCPRGKLRCTGRPCHLRDHGIFVVWLSRRHLFSEARDAKLPRFEQGKPVGSVYTNVLQVPARDFHEGFPGVTDRIEWFVIDYNGRFWIQQAGYYHFSLTSDDGSKLYIDGKLVINNDGLHSVEDGPAASR
jgi:hypothetical protein